MKCSNCGEDVKEGNKFCTNCGALFDSEVSNINKELDINNITPSIKNIDETNNNKVVKKHNKIPLIIISCIVLLGVIASFLCLFVFNKKSSKQIFVDGFKNVTSELFKDNGFTKKSIKNNISFNIETNNTEMINTIDVYNNIKLSSDIELDTNKKQLDEELIINYKGSDLLGFGIYGRDNNMYISLNGIYDKYIKLPINSEQYSILFSNTKNINIIKELLDSAFEKSIDDKYFTKSKKSIIVNGKNKKYNAYTLTITNNNIKDIIKNFVNTLLSNDSFVSMLSTNLKVDKSNVGDLASTIDYSEINLTSPIEITIYTSGLKEVYKGIEVKTSVDNNQYALRYIVIDNNNSELVFDAGVTSLNFKINSTGNNTNNKTTISTDLGIIKVDLLSDTIVSDTINFKDIDTTRVVEYEEFVNNSNDIFNNALENNKALTDFITDISGNMNMSNNNLDYSLTF